MNFSPYPLKKLTCTDPLILKCENSQAKFVDREILVQQLLLAYIRDVRNLEVFIAPDVKKKLFYTTDPNGLWDFCSSVADAAEYGYVPSSKKKRLYLGFVLNGLFSSLSFVSKDKRVSVTDLIDWSAQIDYTSI